MREDDLEAKPKPKRIGSKAAQAVLGAAIYKEMGSIDRRMGRPDSGYTDREAEKLLLSANQHLTDQEVEGIGAGGELMLNMPMEPDDYKGKQLRNTVKDPSMVTASAQIDRLRLAEEAGALDLSLDAADTVEPRNSLEKNLTHQLSALHVLMMRMAGNAGRYLDYSTPFTYNGKGLQANVEACRAMIAAAKATQAYQQGMLTLQRLRSGGKQQLTVVHVQQNVQANEGAQVAITGSLTRGDKHGVN